MGILPSTENFSTTFLVGGAAFVFFALRLLVRHRERLRNPTKLPYPPGPKGWPLIGNVYDIPVEAPWQGYLDLSKKYGDIMYFKALDKRVVILNSKKRVEDLYEKRSHLYSGRPHSVMIHELMDYNNFFSMMEYGPHWRHHRRLLHQHFSITGVNRFTHIVENYAQQFAIDMMEKKDDWNAAARRAIAGLGVKVIYGVHIESENDPIISDSVGVGEGFAQAAIPGNFLVETLPFLKYVPRWMPGSGFKKWADGKKQSAFDAINKPFAFIAERHARGEAEPCMVTDYIDQNEDLTVARNVCTTTHLGALDTAHNTYLAFVLALASWPQVQVRAQEELDRVIGHGVLPVYADRERLPYMNATLAELLRWHPAAPLGGQHKAMEDDVYDGYFIPKGTLVMANLWGILNDPDIWEDPRTFKPERFLKDGQYTEDHGDRPSAELAFGAGRRNCPGARQADQMLWMMLATTMALYNVHPPKDKNGNPIPPKRTLEGGAFMTPGPFEATFEPRSTTAKSTIANLKLSAPTGQATNKANLYSI